MQFSGTLSILVSKLRCDCPGRLGRLLSQSSEVCFACVHGSFLEPNIGFRDVDVGVWIEPSEVPKEQVLDYELELSRQLEREVSYPVDVKVLNYSTLGFRYAASGGALVFARDADLWYQFREETWMHYLDFAPRSKQMLFDLLGVDLTINLNYSKYSRK